MIEFARGRREQFRIPWLPSSAGGFDGARPPGQRHDLARSRAISAVVESDPVRGWSASGSPPTRGPSEALPRARACRQHLDEARVIAQARGSAPGSGGGSPPRGPLCVSPASRCTRAKSATIEERPSPVSALRNRIDRGGSWRSPAGALFSCSVVRSSRIGSISIFAGSGCPLRSTTGRRASGTTASTWA